MWYVMWFSPLCETSPSHGEARTSMLVRKTRTDHSGRCPRLFQHPPQVIAAQRIEHSVAHRIEHPFFLHAVRFDEWQKRLNQRIEACAVTGTPRGFHRVELLQ